MKSNRDAPPSSFELASSAEGHVEVFDTTLVMTGLARFIDRPTKTTTPPPREELHSHPRQLHNRERALCFSYRRSSKLQQKQ